MSLVQSERSKRMKVDGPESERSVQKWTVLSQPGRSRTIVVGLLSHSGRSWVKVDGHSTKSGQSFFGGPVSQCPISVVQKIRLLP